MIEGPLAALDAIEQATGEREIERRRLLPGRHAARRHARLPGGEAGPRGSRPPRSSPA